MAVKTLPKVARMNPRPMGMSIRSYTSLATWPDKEIARASPTSVLTKTLVRIDSVLASIRDIQSSTEYLKIFDTTPSRLRMLEDSLTEKRRLYAAELEACVADVKCTSTNADSFSDYDYLARLPIKTTYNELAPSGDANSLIKELAKQRWQAWIVDTDTLRARYEGPSKSMTERSGSNGST